MSLSESEFVEQLIIPRTHDIGNFEVRRALPVKDRRLVGPFIFWDQMGPGEFLSGQGVDVRPHPHIGLSTITYLFDGSLDHKDSLGNDMRIVPGDVNVMTAGAGIVHSERTGQDIRQQPSNLYGIQSWVAQPLDKEEGSPGFEHTPAEDLPVFAGDGTSGRVVLGEFHGVGSKVVTQWDTLYVDVQMQKGARLDIPAVAEERAIYLLEGQFEIASTTYRPSQLMILAPGKVVTLQALSPLRMIIMGGAVMDGPRYIEWNFVASSRERIEQAKADWRAGRFGLVPGDDQEFIPLP